MADEIAQVVQLEFEGLKFAIKGGVQVASFIARALKALWDWSGDKLLNKKGTHSHRNILKLSKPGLPEVLMVDNRFKDEFAEYCKKQGLRWCNLPDNCYEDGKTPFEVPAQDAPLAAALYKQFLESKISASEKLEKQFDKLIDEARERNMSIISPEERAKNNVYIENLQQAKEERMNLTKDMRASADKGTISFTEYLAMGRGTEFERDPDKAVAEAEHGVPMVRPFEAADCLTPIRDVAYMPESKMRFYLPETGATITREFAVDERNIVYSTYSFKNNSGEEFTFSDRDMTKADWMENVLPKLLDKAQIPENAKVFQFDNIECLNAYMKHFNNIRPKSEINLSEDGKLNFSSPEVERECRSAVENLLKGMASGNINEDIVEFKIPQDKLIVEGGKLTFELDGTKYVFGKTIPGKSENGEISFSVIRDAAVEQIIGDKVSGITSAENVLHDINAARSSGAKNIVSNMMRK